MRVPLLPVVLVATLLVPACASGPTRGDAGKLPPTTYEGLLRRTDVADQHLRAICAPGWKRDPDRDTFFLNNMDEEAYARMGLRHARITYTVYAPPSATDPTQPDRGAPVSVGAWRHRRWWVEPKWAELEILRTDLALARAHGARTLTRLRLSPEGVVEELPTDILRLEVARYGDRPSSDDRHYAVLTDDPWPTVGLLDAEFQVSRRVEQVNLESVARLRCEAYLLRSKRSGAWRYEVLSEAGEPLTDSFEKLRWYEPGKAADSSMVLARTYLLPTPVSAELALDVKQRFNSVLGWPIPHRGTFVPLPRHCLGAIRRSGCWAVYWETNEGVRVAFSSGDVSEMAASWTRARWVDWKEAWYQYLPHSDRMWTLEVAEPAPEGGLAWYAFRDCECERTSAAGPGPWESSSALEAALARHEGLVLADQARIDAELAVARAEREAREAAEAREAEARAQAEAQARASARWEDCRGCGGSGYRVSTREVTTYYSPVISGSNGLTVTTRTSITTSQSHYDGVCGVCGGSGSVQVR